MQTVLIVEDWRELRRRLADRLGEAGCFTLLADTAQEALGVLRSVAVDLMVTRERLADLEGSTLAAVARQQGYEELAIVLQAEDGEAEPREFDDGVVDAVVPRRLDIEHLVRVIRRLLRPVSSLSPPSADFGDTCVPALA